MAPVNDNFADAILLVGASGNATGDNTDATAETGEPSLAGSGLTVWWKWVAPLTGVLHWYSNNALDVYFGVYTGSAVDSLTEIASDDDSGPGVASDLYAPITSGTTYYLLVDAYSAGAIDFSWDAFEATVPTNDNFVDAIELVGSSGSSGPINTALATAEVGEPDHNFDPAGKSIWWKYTPASTGVLIVDSFLSDFDTTLGIYTGSSVDALTVLQESDDSGGDLNTNGQSRLVVPVDSGTTYHIALDGYGGSAVGNATVSWELVTGAAPANDDFANAIVLDPAGGTVAVNNLFASLETLEPIGDTKASVWFKLTAPTTGYFRFPQPTTVDPEAGVMRLSFYSGSTVDALESQYVQGFYADQYVYLRQNATLYVCAWTGLGDQGDFSMTWEPAPDFAIFESGSTDQGSPDPVGTSRFDLNFRLKLDHPTFSLVNAVNNQPMSGSSTGLPLSSFKVSDPKFGYAHEFNAANSTYIYTPFPDSGITQLGSGSVYGYRLGKSVAAFVKIDTGAAGTDQAILRLGWYGFFINTHASEIGKVTVGYYNASAATETLSTPTRLDDGEWHHVVMTYGDGGSDARIRLYVDSELVGERDGCTKMHVSNTGSDLFAIGKDGPFFQKYFTGAVAEAMLTYDEFSLSQVQEIYDHWYPHRDRPVGANLTMNAGFMPIAPYA